VKQQPLTLEETKKLLTAIRLSGPKAKNDFALIISLLFCGRKARTWIWGAVLRTVMDLPADVYNALREMEILKHLDITLSQRDYEKHWGSGLWGHAVFRASRKSTPFTTTEVSRRIKRYAKRAGIKSTVNLRTIINTHHILRKQFGSADLASPLIIEGQAYPAKRLPIHIAAERSRDPRLHGIGRRSATKTHSAKVIARVG
jgi:hypothetical protein